MSLAHQWSLLEQEILLEKYQEIVKFLLAETGTEEGSAGGKDYDDQSQSYEVFWGIKLTIYTRFVGDE